MATIPEQIQALAALVHPPFSMNDSCYVADYRNALKMIVDGAKTDPARSRFAVNVCDYSRLIRKVLARKDYGSLQARLIEKVNEIKEGRDLRVGKDFISLALPAMTLTDGDYTDTLDDLRVRFKFIVHGDYWIEVFSTNTRPHCHPSVYADSSVGFPITTRCVIGNMLLVYDELVDTLQNRWGRYVVCHLRDIRGRMCRNCQQRGATLLRPYMVSATGALIATEGCSLCSPNCGNCGSLWISRHLENGLCPNCRETECPTCHRMRRGLANTCAACSMKCAACSRTKPKSEQWYVTAADRVAMVSPNNGTNLGRYLLCRECVDTHSNFWFTEIDWGRFPALFEATEVQPRMFFPEMASMEPRIGRDIINERIAEELRPVPIPAEVILEAPIPAGWTHSMAVPEDDEYDPEDDDDPDEDNDDDDPWDSDDDDSDLDDEDEDEDDFDDQPF